MWPDNDLLKIDAYFHVGETHQIAKVLIKLVGRTVPCDFESDWDRQFEQLEDVSFPAGIKIPLLNLMREYSGVGLKELMSLNDLVSRGLYIRLSWKLDLYDVGYLT